MPLVAPVMSAAFPINFPDIDIPPVDRGESITLRLAA
jgi:hypothetical protein